LREEWNEDILILFLKIGNIFNVLGKPLLGKIYLDKSLEIVSLIDNIDKKYFVNIYSNLSATYANLSFFKKSLIYQKKAIETFEKYAMPFPWDACFTVKRILFWEVFGKCTM